MSNSPHPLLFEPLSRRLEEEGHQILVTARDNAQTRELTLARWPDAVEIGDSSPPGRVRKAAAIAARVRALRGWAGKARPDLALSHNSYAQAVAARSLGIRTVTAMDYEHQPANHLAFRAANRVVLPEVFPADLARRQGAGGGKVRRYEGLKEEIYLGGFEPTPGARREAGMGDDDGRALVVFRTPPTGSTYHRFGNPGFEALLERIGRQEDCACVLLCRREEERRALGSRLGPNVLVPERALDARSLVYQADLFVGAGGTMTREAALMGVPTVSFFAGQRPAADAELERRGALRIASSYEEVGAIVPRPAGPRSREELRLRSLKVIDAFLRAALD